MGRVNMNRWTANEDEILIDSIQQYPANLTLAFREAAVVLGRTQSSVSGRYYTTLRDREAIITVGSPKGVMINKKVVTFKEDGDDDIRKNMIVAMFDGVDTAEAIETLLGLLSMKEQKDLFKRSVAKLV